MPRDETGYVATALRPQLREFRNDVEGQMEGGTGRLLLLILLLLLLLLLVLIIMLLLLLLLLLLLSTLPMLCGENREQAS